MPSIPGHRNSAPRSPPPSSTTAVKALPRVVDAALAGFAFTDLERHEFAELGTLAVNIVVVGDD